MMMMVMITMISTSRRSSRRGIYGSSWLGAGTALLISLMMSMLPTIVTAAATPATTQKRRPLRQSNWPETIHFHAAIILTDSLPMAYVDAAYNVSKEASMAYPSYKGFQPDLLREIQQIALDMHNITFTFDLEGASDIEFIRQNANNYDSLYDALFDLVSDGCNTSSSVIKKEEDCHRYDLLIGDYYAIAPRPLKADMTPPFLTTSATTIKYTHVSKHRRDITTLSEAQTLGEPVCLLDKSFYDQVTLDKYPNLLFMRCHSHQECIDWLKSELCVLFVEDELQLRYLMVQDSEIEITASHGRASYAEQYIVWPLNRQTSTSLERDLFKQWVYEAKTIGIMDALYDKYFNVNFCPLGFAGANCQQTCNPSHGISNRFGECVCDSTRWTGDDCSIQVYEDLNRIPDSLVYWCYAMVVINFLVCGIFAIWLWFHRKRAQVKIAQPSFLVLILVGCVISTSTIIALAQEDYNDTEDYDDATVKACAVIPWLYSLGFSITTGTLYAKIRRIYVLLQSAAEMKRVTVSVRETVSIVGIVLVIDVAILTVWTIVDPLHWERTVLNEDKYGYALESEGHCSSDHWLIFTMIIGAFHFLLIARACYMCYLARDIPERFSNVKQVTMAMFSNLQILLIAVPILVILGSQPQTSFFVRSVAIWMNDLVIVILIFGNIIYSVWSWDRTQVRSSKTLGDKTTSAQTIQADIRRYAKKVQEKRRSTISGRTSIDLSEFSFSSHSTERCYDWSDSGISSGVRRQAVILPSVSEEKRSIDDEEECSSMDSAPNTMAEDAPASYYTDYYGRRRSNNRTSTKNDINPNNLPSTNSTTEGTNSFADDYDELGSPDHTNTSHDALDEGDAEYDKGEEDDDVGRVSLSDDVSEDTYTSSLRGEVDLVADDEAPAMGSPSNDDDRDDGSSSHNPSGDNDLVTIEAPSTGSLSKNDGSSNHGESQQWSEPPYVFFFDPAHTRKDKKDPPHPPQKPDQQQELPSSSLTEQQEELQLPL